MTKYITAVETTVSTIPARISAGAAPALFSVSEKTEKRFWEFFAATIRNPNTRQAYLTAVFRFSDWCELNRIEIDDIDGLTMGAYTEILTQHYAPTTVKQHLAAIRRLFDWMVLGGCIGINPAHAVRGPQYSAKKGKTPVLTAKETRMLLDSIETDTLVGLRDRALIGLMVYSLARVSAAVSMTVADYYTQGKRSFFRLHEKGGKFHEVPAHHLAQEYLDAYVEASGIGGERKSPLFRSSGRGRNRNTLLNTGISRHVALQMIKRRCLAVGLPQEICNHSFRATGITEYLRNGGELEKAARIANHESTRTTQLYNRIDDELTLDEIERIHI